MPAPSEVVAAPVRELGGAGLLTLAQAHRRRQQQLALQARTALRRLWGFVAASNPQGSWGLVAPRALALLRQSLVEAARGGDSYVAAALRAQGVAGDGAALVPAAFGLSAADGRPLDSLLSYPAFQVGAFVRQGMPAEQALAIGQRHLDRIVTTEVQDAARVATGVSVAAYHGGVGYIRMLTPPSCSRCVVLAGQWYEWNAGFDRHPGDDCVHIPTAEDVVGDVRTGPRDYFDSLSEAEQDRIFTAAGAQAIRDGADISRVVNARRGAAGLAPAGARLTAQELRALRGGRDRGRLERRRVYGHDLYVTTEGTGRRQRKPVRIMPESLYEIANGDRDEAIRLLRFHGYIR